MPSPTPRSTATPCIRTMRPAAFRGFGVTQSAFAVESNMDILARTGHRPHRTAAQERAACGRSPPRAKRCARASGCWNASPAWRGLCADRDGASPWQPWQEGAKRYAWGVAAGYKNTGLGGGAPDKARSQIEVFPDGRAEVRISSAELGQNLVGVLAACTAEELGLPFERVSVLVMDTDRAPDGGPTTASRRTYVSGNARAWPRRRCASRCRRCWLRSTMCRRR